MSVSSGLVQRVRQVQIGGKGRTKPVQYIVFFS